MSDEKELPAESPEQVAVNPNAPVETRKSEKYLVFGKKYKNEGQDEGSFFYKIAYNTIYNANKTEGEPADWKDSHSYARHQIPELVAMVRSYNRDFNTTDEYRDGLKPIIADLPEHNLKKVMVDDVEVKIWTNLSPNGKPYQTVTVGVTYQKDGTLHEGHSFSRGQNAKLEVALGAVENLLTTPDGNVDQTATDIDTVITDSDGEDIPF